MPTPPIKLELIFGSALEHPTPEAQAAYLENACDGDPDLRRRVEALLRVRAAHTSFLAKPAMFVGDRAAPTQLAELGDAAALGRLIGPYKLLERIGEGGFGTVYLAEQREPVQRRVALKIIKLGMDTRQVIARFEAERQALAMMDHPNIARVLDAGATDAGRPYFVMELVRGVPITRYCDEHNLTIRQRLELAVDVCHAVQHAHTKGVIHRDLKPSNVLVSRYDDGGESASGRSGLVKIIDFGIAKATGGRLTEKTLYTEFRQLIGTPAYMSPEQAGLSDLDIDTRSDIYSLGVLLYELLTGTTPFDAKSLVDSGYDEMRRIIREVDPPKPSTRASSLLAAKGSAGVPPAGGAGVSHAGSAGIAPGDDSSSQSLDPSPARCGGIPRSLCRQLRGDLDWIVMKCLEKDRTRRYETANGLAADIKRHLNDEPVTAGAPSTGYKLRKFVKRNRAQVIAGGIVAGALVLGVVGTTGGMIWALNEKSKATLATQSEATAKVQAQENEKKASAEAKRSETVTKFVLTALRAADPVMSGHEGGTEGASEDMTILAAMDNAIKDIDSGRFKDDPATEAILRATIAMILKNNGRFAAAESLTREALEALRRVLGDEHRDTLATISNMGDLLVVQGKLAEAGPYVREALEKARRVLGDEDPDTVSMINNMGSYLAAQAARGQGDLGAAEPYYREALEKRRRQLGDEHPNTLISIHNMGAELRCQGRLTEAEPYLREALEARRRVLGDEHPDTLTSIYDMGVLLETQGKQSEADSYFRQTLEMRQRLFKGDHPDLAYSLNAVATERLRQGRAAEAEQLFVQALEMNQRLFKGDHPLIAKGLDNVAKARQDLDRTAEAEPLLAQALEMRRRLYQGDHPDLATGLNNLAAALQALHRAAEAEPLYVESLEMRRRLYKGDHPAVATCLNNLAQTRHVQGKIAEARHDLDEAVAMLRRFSPDGSALLASALWTSGRARFSKKGGEDAAAALPEFEEALAMAEKHLPPEHPHLKEYRETLAKCRAALAEQGKTDSKGGGE